MDASPSFLPAPKPDPETERRRLERLRMLAVLDSEPEPVFDALTRIAAHVCGVPIALLSLVDEDRQWFKSNLGLEGVEETPRDVAFCAHAILDAKVMEVADARDDHRFAANPLVTGPPRIRFYAGAPIAMPSGERIGTLCVIDRQPQQLSPQQQAALRDLAVVAQWALLQRERMFSLNVVGDESRYRAISYASPLGIFQTDEKGQVFHVNGRWEALLGLPLDHALGREWLAAVHADDAARVRDAWEHAVRAVEPFDQEFRVLRADGLHWVRAQAGPATWGEPPRQGFVGVVEDIDQRKEVERLLRESEERQARAMEASRLALWDLDLTSGTLYLSESWGDLVDGPRQPTITTLDALMQRVPQEQQGRLGQAFSDAMAGRTPRYQVEHQVRRDDGSFIWVHSEGTVVRRDAQGQPLHATGTNQDITARKRAEIELAKAAAITKASLESTADGILVVDTAGEVLLVNRQFQRMWQIPPELVAAGNAAMLAHAQAQLVDPEGFMARVRELTEAPLAEGFDHVEFKDGRVFERYARPMELDGRVTGRVWSFRDITARQKAQAELKQAKEAAEAASRAKTEFLDTMSHEIRTPLNGVLGMLRLLEGEDLGARQRKYLKLAGASADALLNLINDLLDLGKIEAGRLDLERIAFRLEDLVIELGELFTLRSREKGLDFQARLEPCVPPVVIGDPARLRQILNNLLSNALKFTHQGSIGITVAPADPDGAGGTLRFSVHDTGIGIPAAVQQRLFSRFVQADSSTTREYGGTGLGLAIVRQLCEQMGGTVRVESTPGRGSVFHCELPLEADPDAAVSSRELEHHVPAQARSHRILVAEDNLTNQIVVRGLLEQAGYLDVTVVDDGRQAVEAVDGGGFAAVLMDCRMPVMDGYEATTALRRSGSTVPIIALTANASEQERERCLALGMDDYLTKPLDERRLREALDRWAGQVSTAQPAPASPGLAHAGEPPLPANAVPPAAALPVLDRAAALERMGGDEDLFGIALDSFRGQLPRIAPQVRAALAQQQAVEAHRLLHSLAGSSSMVGAEALHACARELEALALAKDLAGVERGLPRLEQQVQVFMTA